MRGPSAAVARRSAGLPERRSRPARSAPSPSVDLLEPIPDPEAAYSQRSDREVGAVLARLEGELKERGFGVLARLPVHSILREKTGSTVDPMVILEVCSPPFALAALEASRWSGLLLPCRVVVSKEGGTTRVSLVRPSVLLARCLAELPLDHLGHQVERRLIEAVDAAVH